MPATVEQVWRWNPVSSPTQFIDSPETPVDADIQWLVWRKSGVPGPTTMTSFAPNAAYLVKVADGTPDFTLQLVGKPVPPRYSWASSGLNFLGFPMQTPATTTPRNFETFLSYNPGLSAGATVFKYVGGPIASNPEQILTPLFEPVRRGQAYWVRSSEYADYYGPLRVTVAPAGLSFATATTALALKITNVTAAPVDATLSLAPSATPPSGQAADAGPVPLRVRGALDPSTGQFAYSDLGASTVYALAPGEEIEVVLAVNRPAMAGNPRDLFQGILQVTDSENISRIDLPVSAETTSLAGLWMGVAVIDRVDQVSASPLEQADGSADVTVSTDADADAPAQFPIRLILHRDASGAVKLLQRVYHGADGADKLILAATEAPLDPARLADARRLSSASFPLGGMFPGSGELGLDPASLSFGVQLGAGMSTNPFVHTYHPDHDEISDSLTVNRAIDLQFAGTAPAGISELGWGSTILGGSYQETFSGLRAQPITVKGTFLINRVSDIDTLTE